MEYCVCGHRLKNHIIDLDAYKYEFCADCICDLNCSDEKYAHVFKLDNLKYIEDLAKEKNLI